MIMDISLQQLINECVPREPLIDPGYPGYTLMYILVGISTLI